MAATLELGPDALLSTTRAVRKRLDLERPVPLELVRECLELALQAPSGSNQQGWHFVVVTDPAKRAALGELYQKGFAVYRNMPVSVQQAKKETAWENRQMERVVDSAEYLAENLGRVPVHLVPCIEGRVDGLQGEGANIAHSSVFGSILPAVWSFMLAARSRALGTAWTTIHLMHEKAAAEILGIPYERVTQVALIPVAYTRGTEFKPARRRDLDKVLHVDAW